MNLALHPRDFLAQGTVLPNPQTTLAGDPERPQFHLLPARNWMNDPNAPVYFDGHYHMFFQYNPHGATWGDMSWNHAISRDMLHWTHLPLAITPTPGGPDAYGCFSGSALTVGKRVYAVYTAAVKSSPELATIKQDSVQETQCLAWSDDPRLVTWTKDPAPILPRPPADLRVTGFRDPSAWKQGDLYYMTVGSGIERVGGCVLLYRSNDLKTWDYLHPLTSGQWNGKPTPNPCDDGEMWECPDFFALGDGHVLIYSTMGKVFWQSGTLDKASMTFQPMKNGLLDLDAFYAPKTQLDAGGNRILWGWIPERRSEAAMRQAGWSGMMSLPRLLTLDSGGALRIQVPPETRTLRGATLLPVKDTTGQSVTLDSANGEVRCEGLKNAGFRFILSLGPDNILELQYEPHNHAFLVGEQQITLEPHDAPVLHGFVDGSVVELIIGERIGYTKRFYYRQTVAPPVVATIRGHGVKVEAWAVRPISPDRLTT